MLKVDTIHNAYNLKERLLLDNELRKLETERDKALASIPNEEEYDEKFDEVSESYRKLMSVQFLKCFAAQFPKCRNKWFLQVVKGIPLNKWKEISAEQYNAFLSYAGYKDDEHWKTHETYCRVANCFVTLKWKNGFRAIKVENLA